MMHHNQLIPEQISPYFKWNENIFSISDITIDDIMGFSESPNAYIYDLNTIKYNYDRLRDALPGNVEIVYAMKANPNIALVNLITSLGAGCDTVSSGELYICEQLGVLPQKVVYTSPVKTRFCLEKAIDMGVYVNIESIDEAIHISEIAQSRDKVIKIGIRINPDFTIEDNHLKISGKGSSKFGLDYELIDDLIKRIIELPCIEINGIHISVASGVLSVNALIGYYENCFKLARKLRSLINIERIDFGGGLGIPYFINEKPLDVYKLGDGLKNLISEYREFNETKIIIEPGRYLIGQAGIYVCRIDHVKRSGDRDIIVVEGGINHYSRPALIDKANPTHNLSNNTDFGVYDIADYTATSVGYIGKSLSISNPKIDNYIGIFNAGSYGYTQSTIFFSSLGFPPELLINDGRIDVIRRKVLPEDFLKNQFIPNANV